MTLISVCRIGKIDINLKFITLGRSSLKLQGEHLKTNIHFSSRELEVLLFFAND